MLMSDIALLGYAAIALVLVVSIGVLAVLCEKANMPKCKMCGKRETEGGICGECLRKSLNGRRR